MKVNISILILASLFFFSCEQEVELKVNTSEPCYVIEARITLGEFAKVNIVESKNYGEDNQYSPVRNVMVSVSDNTGEKEILELMASGLYESKEMKGIEGRTYHLNVEIEHREYTSVATMPHAVQIEDMTMIKTMTDSYFPKITYNDPPGIRNYYRAILYINGKRMPGMEVMDDKDTDGKKNSSLILFDPEYNGGEDIKKGDVVRIEMQCLDEGAYTYFESLNRINESLANPTSNITGGALGYFGVYTCDTKEIITDW